MKFFTSIVLFSAMLILSGVSFALQNVTSCPVISASDTYVMQNDLVGAPNSAFPPVGGSVCVKIGAPNVVFDCNGFLITNNGTANITYGIELNSSATNVTVMNCPGISQYATGIVLIDSSFNNFTSVVSHSNAPGVGPAVGFLLTGQTGGSHNNTFSMVSAVNNTAGGVISLINSSNNTFTDSNFSNNGGDGLNIATGSGNRVMRSTISNNSDEGIEMTGSSISISENQIFGNAGTGIAIDATGVNVVINNVFNNGGDGIQANAAGLANFAINNATNNTGHGFSVIAPDFGNFAINNASLNGGHGLSVIGGDIINFAINYASFNGGTGISSITGEDTNFAINTAFGNGGPGFTVVSGNSPNFAINNATGNGGTGFSVVTGNNSNWDFNSATGNDGFGFSVVSENLADFDGNTAAANNGTGFSISGSLMSLHSNTASGNFEGLSVSGSGNNLTGNNLTGNSGAGIMLSGQNPRLANNSVSHNQGIGIRLLDNNVTSMSGDHLFNNSPDFYAESDFLRPFDFTMDGVVFDSPGGNFVNYTNLSMTETLDLDAAFHMSWSPLPAPLPPNTASFAGKFIEITREFGTPAPLDTTVWHWLDSELLGVNEQGLRLWHYNGSVWALMPFSPDQPTNTLTATNLSNFSVFALLQTTTTSSGGDGGGGSGGNPDLAIVFNPDGNVVTVTSDGSPVPGATVRVNGSIIGTTDSAGQVAFSGCGGTAFLSATKEGYHFAETTVSLAACGGCVTNADCPDMLQCVSGTCGPVACACGTVSNHQCVAFQCCSDTDCASGQSCVDHSCVQSGCASDSDCADSKFCDIPAGQSNGACRDIQVGACGQVVNHKFVPYGYECGTEPGCPSCPSGQSCTDHKCVAAPGDLNCPSTGVVGASASCTATNCANCDFEVTDPSGKKSTGTTDASGKLTIPLAAEGTYMVTLLKDGQVVKTLQVKALPKTPGGEEPPPTATSGPDLGMVLLVLILLALVVFGILYWRSRRGKG